MNAACCGPFACFEPGTHALFETEIVERNTVFMAMDRCLGRIGHLRANDLRFALARKRKSMAEVIRGRKP